MDNKPFVKDVNELFKQYEPLRRNVVKKYKSMINPDDLEELIAFTDETFIILAYEYQNYQEEKYDKGIDFNGYISRMLKTRVHGSFVIPHLRKRGRETPLADEETTVSDLIDARSSTDNGVFLNRSRGGTVTTLDIQQANKIDSGYIELQDELEHLGLNDEITQSIIDDIVIEGLSPMSAVADVARKLDIPKDYVIYKYRLLYDYLGLSRGIIDTNSN